MTAIKLHAQTCIEEMSNNRIAQAEIADHVGFCSNHASRDLLHQDICKYSTSCFWPSVMDFLNIDVDYKDRRNSNFALLEILKKKEVHTNDCISLDKFFKPNTSKEYNSYSEKFLAAIKEIVVDQCKQEQQDKCLNGTNILSDEIQQMACSSTMDIEYLYRAIRKNYLNLICLPNEIPNFQMQVTHYDVNNKDETTKSLNKLLKEGHQVKIVTNDPHAIVVSNYRFNCVKGEKVLQYQVLDSLYNTKWSDSKQIADWVDGETLIKNLHSEVGFTWLEPKDNSLQ